MRNSSDLRRLSADLKRFSFDLTINSIEEGKDEFVDSVDDDELVDEIDCLLLKI